MKTAHVNKHSLVVPTQWTAYVSVGLNITFGTHPTHVLIPLF